MKTLKYFTILSLALFIQTAFGAPPVVRSAWTTNAIPQAGTANNPILTGTVTLDAMTPGSTNGIYAAGSTTLLRRFQAAAGAGGQSVGENIFVGNSGNSTMSNGAGSTSLASYNTAVGDSAFLTNTTGQYNTAIGHGALVANTTGSFNTAVGGDSLNKNTTGPNNTAVGTDALFQNTTGQKNTAVGVNALNANTTGEDNTAVGLSALLSSSTGVAVTAVGASALANYTGGFQVTALGYTAGYSLTSGNFSTFIGNEAGNNASQKVDAANSMALGNGSYTTANNQVVIGNTSITETLLRGNVVLNSPIRLKGYTVATLPAGTQGDTAFVTDATAPTYLGALVGGGAVVCPVFYNGSAWVSH